MLWSHCLAMSDSLGPQWTVAHQAPLSMGLSRQEYWSGFPFFSPGDLPGSGIEPASPTFQADSLLLSHQGSPGGASFSVLSYIFKHSWKLPQLNTVTPTPPIIKQEYVIIP